MNLTKEQLETVEELAYRLITPDLVAINLEVDEIDFLQELRTPGTSVRNAYYKGYIRQVIELSESLIKSAKNGSNPAQIELIRFLKTAKLSIEYE